MFMFRRFSVFTLIESFIFKHGSLPSWQLQQGNIESIDFLFDLI